MRKWSPRGVKQLAQDLTAGKQALGFEVWQGSVSDAGLLLCISVRSKAASLWGSEMRF